MRRRHTAIIAKKRVIDYFRLTALEDDTTFSIVIGSAVNASKLAYLEYSTNEGRSWIKVTNTSSIVTINIPNIALNNSVILRGSGSNLSISNSDATINQTNFNADKNYKISGVLMTLLKGKYADANTLMDSGDFNFCCLFDSCTTLVDAENLVLAPNVNKSSYRSMFYGCTSLQKAPLILPSQITKETSYYFMFRGCTSLVTTPIISATTLATQCCQGMFQGCTSLTIAPSLSFATTLSGSSCCQNMFYGCTSLVSAPSILPATTLTDSCYYGMFQGCTSLVRAVSELPATTLAEACYRNMFYGCTSLEIGPTIKASVLSKLACHSMFNSCTKLTYVRLLALNISANQCLYQWLPADTMTNLEIHRSPEATWWTIGKGGIPIGSVLFDDTELESEEVTFIDSEVQRIVLSNWGNRKPKHTTYSGGGATHYEFRSGVRIGGIDGKILKKQLANVRTILTEFKGSSIVDFSDFAEKFPNLHSLGAEWNNYLGGLSSCFQNCTSLKYITIPNTVVYLGAAYTYSNGCFQDSGIESIYIPDSVTTAGDHLFYSCKSLKTVRWSSNLPTRVNPSSYYSGVFEECSNLETIENYPTTIGSIVPAYNWRNCSKLDIFQFYSLLQGAVNVGTGSIRGTKVTNLPQDLIFYNLVSCAGGSPGNLAGVGRRRLFLPKVTTISQHGLANNSASLIDLGNVTGTYFYPGNGNSSTNTVTVILRSTAVPTFSTFNKTNVQRIYVYDSIIDDFKADSKCSTAASITFPIGGEEWFQEFGSYYEYADYPVSDPVVYNENLGGNISIIFPMYNPDITLRLQFRGTDYRSIVLPFADVHWEYTRMGGDEFREIIGVTATVDGEGNLTGFTVQSQTVTGNITPNKPYLVTSGMNGLGISGEDYTEILHSDSVVQPTNAITDEFTSNGYKFSFTGTYNFIDNMEGKYAFDGTNWNLCSSNDTMKATYVYMEITKLEE